LNKLNTGELLLYQNTKGNIKLVVSEETKSTPEESNVCRKLYPGKGFDPGRGRTSIWHNIFYKHVIPLGLRAKPYHYIIHYARPGSHILLA
jgi:hypothetical protein